MKCKLNRDCHRKKCTKYQWCRYEPWNIPRAGLSEAWTKRRMTQISNVTRLIYENTASYAKGFKAGLNSPPCSHGYDFTHKGYNHDQRRAHRLGVEAALKARDEGDKDRARRARWEAGAIRRGELSESEREYSHHPREYSK